MDDGAVMHVVADTSCESGPFTVAAQTHQILGGVEVLHPFDFLLDDRAGVEFAGDVVAGCADEFDAALVGLAVGVGTDEGGQE